ncbi:MAG: MscL family protein [Candidatus Taylorbacteria bacterium]|nr:MscL family protein [Candidatus Taylorbacteria bacterium]
MLKEQLAGFIHFIRTQGVVGFATGFILGKATSDLVGSFVNDVINPIIGLAFARFTDLANLGVTINGSTIAYGKTLSLLINFFILAAVVYFVIKRLSTVLDKPKDAPPPAPPLPKK